MGKKLKRFEEIAAFPNVSEYTDFQSEEIQKPKGKWKAEIFENDHPITLELACGKGEYALKLSKQFPQRNIIGIDIKGARIWKGASRALQENRENIHFLRVYIDHLEEYFGAGEVDDIWITFPDPYPKGSDRNKRLTSPKFLSIYQKVLAPNGTIRLKTDSDQLFSYTKWTIEQTECKVLDVVEDIYDERPDDPLLTHKTYFEKKHLKRGRTISYIEFSLPDSGELAAS